MLRSLSSGVTGLQANQAAIDVIGNNIANVNTVGFKAARTVFADLLSETIGAEQAPSEGSGGKDPMQVGRGTSLAAIRTAFSPGITQTTNNATDFAIQGDGFFVLSTGTDTYYSRAGAFTVDAEGRLVDTVSGYRVQGASGDITILAGSMSAPNATATALFGGNLDAAAADGTTYTATFSVHDSLGDPHTLTTTFTKDFATAAGRWNWTVTEADAAIASLTGAAGNVVFDDAGAVTSGGSATLGLTYAPTSGVTSPQSITLDFGSPVNSSPITGFASASTVSLSSEDGYSSGTLRSFLVNADGTIVGSYDNGRTAVIDRLQLAVFSNPGGLVRSGSNLFHESVNSGVPTVGNPGEGGRGALLAGSLEGSNVDLAREFTDLITAQRGFEANSRVIRVADDILQTVVNLKQ